MTATFATLADLEREASALVARLRPATGHATLITLSGELGAGKTAFTKALASALGIEEPITSPTFVLEKIYELQGESRAFSRLVHIDAYRLKDALELAALGFDEIMQDPANLVVLEWPERVERALPAHSLGIRITALHDGSRSLSYLHE